MSRTGHGCFDARRPCCRSVRIWSSRLVDVSASRRPQTRRAAHRMCAVFRRSHGWRLEKSLRTCTLALAVAKKGPSLWLLSLGPWQEKVTRSRQRAEKLAEGQESLEAVRNNRAKSLDPRITRHKWLGLRPGFAVRASRSRGDDGLRANARAHAEPAAKPVAGRKSRQLIGRASLQRHDFERYLHSF